MPFALRPLEERDVAQSAEIERDAFPTLFPPTSFRRELKNRLASYLVAWRRDDVPGPATQPPDTPDIPPRAKDGPFVGKLLRNTWSLWPGRHGAWEPGRQLIAGFVGTWYVVDEAHIVAVGVRSAYRGRGIGELLLIGGIEQAMARHARVVTLEVRVSNHVARNLYLKYGFKERGVRKAYYADNHEDALIFTTDPILVPPYPEQFETLLRAHERRWGCAERRLS